MQIRKITLVLAVVILGFTSAIAQQLAPLPIDPNVRYGKLENGLTYYVRHRLYIGRGKSKRPSSFP